MLMMVLTKGFERGWVAPQGLQTRGGERRGKEKSEGPSQRDSGV